ncbi:MAG: beta-Ala-His dipeptidase [Deltaproteobacteria bacterium]|nr:beta-Ala-His dipeptidase [Deltaproteobacteria bacterium]
MSESSPIDPALVGLQPASMWRIFGDLARIPHGTGNEAGVREYVQAFAANKNIACEVNEIGDLLLRVRPDAKGPIVALQAHMDMVCVAKDGLAFDFARDPIRLVRDGDFIRADGTTLGADNGIGVAYALALVDEVTGPLEVLLTVDEEKGFTGIEGVAPGWLHAKILINIDSEEEGYLTIASAGGRDFVVQLPGARQDPSSKAEPLSVTIDGLKGGHSGVEIHRGRTNALKVMGQVLATAKACGGVVFGMDGGTAPNVIPSSAKAVVGLPVDRKEEFKAQVAALQRKLITEEDPVLRIEIAAAQESRKPLTDQASARLVAVIDETPSGVIIPSKLDPTQPFVSNNLAMVKELADGGLAITMMSRSPAIDELMKLGDRYRGIADKNGASMEAGRVVPGWAPNYDSPLLALFQKKYKEQSGKDAKVFEIHAGLECGALQGKYPGMDLISVGPDITGVHSPDEKVSIESARRTFDLVRAVIQELHRN